MTISNESLLAKFYERHRGVIGRLHLQDSELLNQLDSIIIAPLPDGIDRGTKLNTLNLFFEILNVIPVEYLDVLRALGIRFLLKDADAWVKLEYIIHNANPTKASGLLKAFANIINYSHGVYETSKIITTTKLVGNEHHLRVHSASIVYYDLFDTQLFFELRTLTASINSSLGMKGGKTTLVNSLRGFFEILSIFSTEQVRQLKRSGLRSLISDKEAWVQLEFHIYKASKVALVPTLVKQLNNLVNYSNGIYEQSEHITTTNHDGLETPVLRDGYMVSVEFFNALVDWKVKELRGGTKPNSVRHSLIGATKAIRYIKSSDEHKDDFSVLGLKIFNENIGLSERLKRDIPEFTHISMIAILSRLGINYPNYRVLLHSKKSEVFLKNTYKHSKVIFGELRGLAENEEFKGIKRGTASHYFSDFDSIGLPLLKVVLSDDEFKNLCEFGLSYLDNDDIYEKIDEHAKQNEKITAHLGLSILKTFLKKDVNLIKVSKYTLYFSGISRNGDIKPFNMDVLGNVSEKAFEEFKLKHEEFMKNIDSFDISEISYHSQLQNFVAGLKKVLPKLSCYQIGAIKDDGLSAFVDSKYKISITCLEKFQSLAKSKSENAKTVREYRSSFRSCLARFVGEVPDLYVISTKKDEAIKKLSYKSDEYYTVDEVSELAFYIDKALIIDNISLRDKIYLYYAKIQIKTGWNQQPLLDLSLDRLTKRVNPITNQMNYDLVLVKNRRSYKPSTYDFNEDQLKDRDLRSVIRDIIFVRDELTSELREVKHLDNYLFIEPCENNGARRIDSFNLRRLPSLISNLGCKVHYNPRKVRKGGVNFIYKNIAKSVREYERLSDHSYQTFIESYKEISKVETVEKLSDGIDIMANYFSGKEIYQNLHAIDDLSEIDNAQEIPTGVCSSTSDSDEVRRYNKLNAKVVDEGNKYCGDFLACIWCKYFKVVKDADHIWKLLSYKEYVVSSMERAIVDNEEPEEQRGFVDLLSKRVDDIMSFIEEIKPDVVEKAKVLIETQGLHPDWEFAFPLSSTVGDNYA